MQQKTVSIGWSFPTSPNAQKMGFYRDGCWTVSIHGGNIPGGKAINGFSTFDEAKECAEKTGLPWDKHTSWPVFIA